MKYLDLLMKLKEAGQTAERCKRELANIAESGKTELHRTEQFLCWMEALHWPMVLWS